MIIILLVVMMYVIGVFICSAVIGFDIVDKVKTISKSFGKKLSLSYSLALNITKQIFELKKITPIEVMNTFRSVMTDSKKSGALESVGISVIVSTCVLVLATIFYWMCKIKRKSTRKVGAS